MAAIVGGSVLGERAGGTQAPAALQAQLDALSAAGGGELRLAPGARHLIANGVVVPPRVTLDLNGGEIVAVLNDANAAGVRLLSDSAVENGTVSVLSRGSPGIQAGAHAPVLVGALLDENPRTGQISPFEAPSGWRVSGMTLRSDKLVRVENTELGAPAIQVMGGAHRGVIEDINVPDSARMAGGVFLDWGTVGDIRSDDVAGSARRFLAGAAYTTHPHDIAIRDIRIGRLSRSSAGEAGSMAVRLSGVHDVAVAGVAAALVTQAGFRFTAGDLGFEFAREPSRSRAHRGVTLADMRIGSAGSHLVRTDSYADNIGRAAQDGYRPRLPPIAPTDLRVANVSGAWNGIDGPGWGLRIDHQRGGSYQGLEARGFRYGFAIDEQVEDVVLQRLRARGSIDAAMLVGHPHRPPRRIRVSALEATGTGADAAVLRIERSEDIRIERSPSVTARVSPRATGLRIVDGSGD